MASGPLIIQTTASASPKPIAQRGLRLDAMKAPMPRVKASASGASSIAMRPALTKGRLVNRTSAERRAARCRSKTIPPIQKSAGTLAAAHRADGRRAAHSLAPKSLKLSAIAQMASGGLSKKGAPRHWRVIQSPERSISFTTCPYQASSQS
ncbi:hypothetical protein D3C86_1445270 [compost metagenome]